MELEAFGKVFELVNDNKHRRATQGTNGANGQLHGGRGVDASPEEIIAEYDRLGGLILFNGDKVKKGCFYDFKNKKDVKEPEVLLEFMINGKLTIVPADEPLPPLVRAAKEAESETTDGEEEKEAEEETPTRRKSTTLMGGTRTKRDKAE